MRPRTSWGGDRSHRSSSAAMRWLIASVAIFLVTMILRRLAQGSPETVERVYALKVFPAIARGLSLLTGWLPFSLMELLVGVVVASVVVWVIRTFIIVRRTAPGARIALAWRRTAPIIAVVLLFQSAFTLLWGLNYNRRPFGETIGLTTQPASVDELAALCADLISRANTLRASVSEDASGVMRLNGSIADALQRAQLGYDRAGAVHPVLAGHYSRPKGVLVSRLWVYTGVTGMYSPYTGEANIGTDQPLSAVPHTVSHEMAHQHGFAREDEANYIAYLVCQMHPDADFRYSGVLAAVIYTANALNAVAPERYEELAKAYSDAVRRDLRAESAFWSQHDGLVAEISDSLNDQYLKSNGQADGSKSYGRMVDLLLAEYRARR